MFDLSNVSFLISLKVDSQDRIDNLDITIAYLQNYFKTNIIICEQDSEEKLAKRYNCEYIFYKTDTFFNRQRGVNIAAKAAKTPIIAHYDADVLFEPLQILRSVEAIVKDQADIVYPYNGWFLDVPKSFHESIKTTYKLSAVDVNQCLTLHNNSVGGALFFKTDIFWTGGGANERFKGLGWEDNEIFTRFQNLGYRIGRVPGPLLHLTHIRKETSFNYNPYGAHNQSEFQRIASLSRENLLKEIKDWDWLKL